MNQFVIAVIGTIIGGIILLNIEYKAFVPQTVDAATRAEHKVRELKRQVEAEVESEALQARLNAKRIEQENSAREVRLQLEREQTRQEEAKRRRQQQSEADRRARADYVNNWRRANHGCDPPLMRYCTYVQGQKAGCSCM